MDGTSIQDIEKMHKEILWPTIRIRAKGAWGSGTVIYNDKDAKGNNHIYVITCHHVVSSNIKVEKKWDSKAGMDVKKEIRTPVEVQLFYYEELSHAKGLAGSYRANIVTYDADQDIALLEVDRKKPIDEAFLAWMFPVLNVDKEIHVFDKVYACGAALAHEPIVTDGIITFMDEIIDDYNYWMSTAQIIFGNSGGAMFRYSDERKRFEFIGVPARVAVSISGFSANPITHMGFFVPITRICKHLEENDYHFIFSDKVTYEECEIERNRKKAEARKLFMSKFGEVQPESRLKGRKAYEGDEF